MSYFDLPYNPADFDKDLRYLKMQQKGDIETYNNKKYARNKEHITTIAEHFVKSFIERGANVYKFAVNYPDWDMEKEWIEKRRIAIHELEKYWRYNRQALFWTYKQNGDWKFKGYHASSFIMVNKADRTPDYVIVRTGQFFKSKSEGYWYYFSLWKDGKVYSTTARGWSHIPSAGEIDGNDAREISEKNNSKWEPDTNYQFTDFPFTLIGKDLAQPILSTLPAIENIRSGGVAFGEIAQQRSFLEVVYGVGNIPTGVWQKAMKRMRMFEFPLIPASEDGTTQNELKSLSLGSGDVQEKWTKFMDNSIRKVATAEGVDTNGMFGEMKVESGYARLISLEPVMDVRNENIIVFREFEEENQQLLIKLGIVANASIVEYSPLEIGITEGEKEDVKKKRQDNIVARFAARSITRIQMIMEMENLTEEMAIEREKEVLKERLGGDNGEDNKNEEKSGEEGS